MESTMSQRMYNNWKEMKIGLKQFVQEIQAVKYDYACVHNDDDTVNNNNSNNNNNNNINNNNNDNDSIQ